jgi:hypothetical protein
VLVNQLVAISAIVTGRILLNEDRLLVGARAVPDCASGFIEAMAIHDITAKVCKVDRPVETFCHAAFLPFFGFCLASQISTTPPSFGSVVECMRRPIVNNSFQSTLPCGSDTF